jgi:nucleoside 2-deoxyribosyltransferase
MSAVAKLARIMGTIDRKCFVLMPFRGDLEDLYHLIIQPTLTRLGYTVQRADSIASAGNIIRDILQNIVEADLIIAEVTGRNPNVFYELAVAHTLGKPTIMLTRDYQDIPFDLKAYRMIVYDISLDKANTLKRDLTRAVQVAEREEVHSSPVRDFLPNVPSLDEISSLRQDVELLQARLETCEEDRQLLEKRLAEQSISGVDPEQLIHELINNQAIQALQHKLVAKDEEINQLLHRPETADTQLQKLKIENQQLLNDLQLMRTYLQVQPHWGMPPVNENENYVFVLMPYKEEWSDIVWEIIKSTVVSEGLICERADDKTGKFVMQDIWSGINAARIVIADLTEGNPNVTYEVGMCDVLGKSQILLAQNPKAVPFDFLGIRLVPYNYVHGGIAKLKEDLRGRIRQITGRAV